MAEKESRIVKKYRKITEETIARENALAESGYEEQRWLADHKAKLGGTVLIEKGEDTKRLHFSDKLLQDAYKENTRWSGLTPDQRSYENWLEFEVAKLHGGAEEIHEERIVEAIDSVEKDVAKGQQGKGRREKPVYTKKQFLSNQGIRDNLLRD